MGHFVRDCTEPRTDQGRVCYNCKSPGTTPLFNPSLPVFVLELMLDHQSRECPEPRMNGNYGGHQRRTERDTLSGTSILLVPLGYLAPFLSFMTKI